jgi:hypothetical protein
MCIASFDVYKLAAANLVALVHMLNLTECFFLPSIPGIALHVTCGGDDSGFGRDIQHNY